MSGCGRIRGEAGYSLVALLATATILLILLSAAMPTWRYIVKNDREEELIFRGGEIADAVAAYQRKNGNSLPVSLEVLVKGKYLRHAYKDPMTKDGKWRFIRPGESLNQPGAPGAAGPYPGVTTTTTTTTTRPSAFSQPTTMLGGFLGVASTSTDSALRVFNGRTKYNEWVFLPGQPRVIGRPIGLPAGVMPGGPAGGQGLMPIPQPRPGGVPGAGVPGGIGPQAQPYVVPP